MRGSVKKFWRRLPVLLVLLSLLAFSGALYAQDEGVSVYKKDDLEVIYRPISTGVSIDLVNRTDKDLTNVQLNSEGIPNLKLNNQVLKVAKVPARSIQTFNVTYQLPGATDNNPNTPSTSMRFLPRTGTLQLLYTGGGLLLLGLATGGFVLVRKRKSAGKAIMSLLLTGGILASAGLVPSRIEAAERERFVKVPITGVFTLGNHSFDYKGELTFQVRDVKEVEETRSEVVKFEKKVEIDKDLPVVKDDNSDHVFLKQKGVDGKKELTVKVTYVNGQKVKEETVSEKLVVKPVDEITLMGGKPVERQKALPFATHYRADEGIATGAPNRILIRGVDGKLTTTYTRAEDGTVQKNEQTKAPVDQMEAVANSQIQPAEATPFKVVWQGDPNALYDPADAKVVRPGVEGLIRQVKLLSVNPRTGALGEPYGEGATIVDHQPTDELRSAGQLYKVTEVLPFEEERQEDPNKPSGWTELVQAGENGSSIRTLRGQIDPVTGKIVKSDQDQQVGPEERTEPTKKIIKVGTGELQTKEQAVTETIPFRTVYKGVDTLPFGQSRTATPGQAGLKTSYVDVPWDFAEDRELTIPGYEPKVVRTEEQAPVDQVVEVGVVKTESEEFQADPIETVVADRWGGWRQVTKPAVPGLRETKTRYALKDGRVTDAVEGTPVTTVVRQPVAEEAKVGKDGTMLFGQADSWVDRVREEREEASRQDLVLNQEAVVEARQAAYDWSKDKEAAVTDGKQLLLFKKEDYGAKDPAAAKAILDDVYQEIMAHSSVVKNMLIKGEPENLGIAYYENQKGDLFVAVVID